MEKQSLWKTLAIVGCTGTVLFGTVATWSLLDRSASKATANTPSAALVPFSIDEVNEIFDTRAVCYRDLNACTTNLQDTMTAISNTTTREYVLESGVSLVRQSIADAGPKNVFWLLPAGTSPEAVPDARLMIGEIPIMGQGDAQDPFSINRIDGGLYEFRATADYLEAQDDTHGWIRPESRDYLLAKQFQPGRDSIEVRASGYAPGVLKAQTNGRTCTSSNLNFEPAQVTGILWNDELIYRPSAPFSVECDNIYDAAYARLFGSIGPEDNEDGAVSYEKNLKSLTIPLTNGKALTVRFGTGAKPTVTVK